MFKPCPLSKTKSVTTLFLSSLTIALTIGITNSVAIGQESSRLNTKNTQQNTKLNQNRTFKIDSFSSTNQQSRSPGSLGAVPTLDEARRMPSSTVLQAIRRTMKQQFGISKINIMSISEQNWPDGCLGLPSQSEACTLEIVPGWRIEVSDRSQTWVYRTDRTGANLRLENPDQVRLPQATAQKLIQHIAKETKIFPNQLKIAEVKKQEFSGCFGLYRPNQACTAIAISGWQAIVTTPSQTLVYHLNQNASQIVRNETASGAKRSVRVSFERIGDLTPIDGNIIFQSQSSGDLTGKMTRIFLMNDGKLMRYDSTAKPTPVLLKTLSPRQVNAFKQVLETELFPNFNGLTYLTTAALADYPTTTYQSPYISMQLIDLERRNLPRSLQAVMVQWERLIRS